MFFENVVAVEGEKSEEVKEVKVEPVLVSLDDFFYVFREIFIFCFCRVKRTS